MVVNLEINEQVCETIAYDGAGMIGRNIFFFRSFSRIQPIFSCRDYWDYYP